MPAVPALHRDPDIQILDDNNVTEFTLIEHGKTYNGSWNPIHLNQDDYNEGGSITFTVENWIYLVTNVGRWISRQDLGTTQKSFFKVIQSRSDNGSFSFMQTTRALRGNQFGVMIILVRKQTKHLNIIYTSSFLSFLPTHLITGGSPVQQFCQKWYQSRFLSDIDSEKLKGCPCTLEAAKMDPTLKLDFTCSPTEPQCHENVNAHRCYLMKLNDTT